MSGQPHKAQVMIRYSKPTSGWTMLHQAAWWGNQAAVNELVKLGSDPERQDKRGKTPKQITDGQASQIKWP